MKEFGETKHTPRKMLESPRQYFLTRFRALLPPTFFYHPTPESSLLRYRSNMHRAKIKMPRNSLFCCIYILLLLPKSATHTFNCDSSCETTTESSDEDERNVRSSRTQIRVSAALKNDDAHLLHALVSSLHSLLSSHMHDGKLTGTAQLLLPQKHQHATPVTALVSVWQRFRQEFRLSLLVE